MHKKVFISYSWTTPAHEDWVLNLAQRLMQDGIDVILDKWDLKAGHDSNTFMEQMVHATDIDKVLIILDKKYTEKADGRTGGVGTETTIISAQVYKSATQEKFIPIVAERDADTGSAPIPIYLSGRIYVDLSQDDHFETEYEKLLREIYARPFTSKPTLGKAPKYLFEDSGINYKTTTIARTLDSQLDRHPTRLNSIAKDFFEEMMENLRSLALTNVPDNSYDFGAELISNFAKAIPLRDDYITFIDKVAKNGPEFDVDILTGFLEKLTSLLYPSTEVQQWKSYQFENYRFLIHEFWLYTVAISLKRENYTLLAELFHHTYFDTNPRNHRNEPKGFDLFYHHVEAIKDYHEKQHSTKFLSSHADLLIKRIPEGFTKEDLADADLLCYYIAQFQNSSWFPMTYIYRTRWGGIPFLSRLISTKHFEKVKAVLGFETTEELKSTIEKLSQERDRGYSHSHDYIPNISRHIEAEKIGTGR